MSSHSLPHFFKTQPPSEPKACHFNYADCPESSHGALVSVPFPQHFLMLGKAEEISQVSRPHHHGLSALVAVSHLCSSTVNPFRARQKSQAERASTQ